MPGGLLTARDFSRIRIVRIRVLGGCEVETTERKVALRFRQAELLGLLAVRRGRVARATAAALLWPDAEPSTARHNLRQTLVALRSGSAPIVSSEGESLVLIDARIDLWELEESLSGDFGPEPVEELLPDVQSEWIVPVRAALTRTIIEACRRQAEAWIARDPAQALAYADLALMQDPWLESSHAVRVRALLASGDRSRAELEIATFERGLDLGSKSRLRELLEAKSPDPFLGIPFSKLSPNERVRLLSVAAPAFGGRVQVPLEEALADAPALNLDDRARAEATLSGLALDEGNVIQAEEMAQAAVGHATDIDARSASALALARVLVGTDRSLEAERLLDQALVDDDPERRAGLLVARAAALARRHALVESERDSRAAIALARATGCLRLLAKARYNLATVALWAGKFEMAQREAEAGIGELDGIDHGDPGGLLLTLGRVLQAQGFWSKAAECYEQAVESMRESGPRTRLAQGLTIAADLHRRRGNHDNAATTYKEAIGLWRTLGDRVGLATALKGYGQILVLLGDRIGAEKRLREAIEAYLAGSDPLGGAAAMLPLARILLEEGRAGEALPFAKRACERLREMRADASGLTSDETLSLAAAQQLLEEIQKCLAKSKRPGQP